MFCFYQRYDFVPDVPVRILQTFMFGCCPLYLYFKMLYIYRYSTFCTCTFNIYTIVKRLTYYIIIVFCCISSNTVVLIKNKKHFASQSNFFYLLATDELLWQNGGNVISARITDNWISGFTVLVMTCRWLRTRIPNF